MTLEGFPAVKHNTRGCHHCQAQYNCCQPLIRRSPLLSNLTLEVLITIKHNVILPPSLLKDILFWVVIIAQVERVPIGELILCRLQ